MKIYYVIASVNDAGKVTCGQFQDEADKIRFPYEWDKKQHVWVNVSGWYTPSEIRYRMKKQACSFDWK